MNTRISKFLALALVLSMVMSTFAIVPMTVSAAGVDYNTTPYASLVDISSTIKGSNINDTPTSAKNHKMFITDGSGVSANVSHRNVGGASLNSLINALNGVAVDDTYGNQVFSKNGVYYNANGLLPTLDQGSDSSYKDAVSLEAYSAKEGTKTFNLSGKFIKGITVVMNAHTTNKFGAGAIVVYGDGTKSSTGNCTPIPVGNKTASNKFLIGTEAGGTGEYSVQYADVGIDSSKPASKISLHVSGENTDAKRENFKNINGIADGIASGNATSHTYVFADLVGIYEVEYSFNELDAVLKNAISSYKAETDAVAKESLYNSIKLTIDSAVERGYDANGRDNGWKALALESFLAETTTLANRLVGTYPSKSDYDALVEKLEEAKISGLISSYEEGLTSDALAKYNAAKAIVESPLEVTNVVRTDIKMFEGVKITFNTPISGTADEIKSAFELNGTPAELITKSENDTVLNVVWGDLDYSTQYTATVLTTLKNIYGNTLALAYQFDFTTEGLPDYVVTVSVPKSEGSIDVYADSVVAEFSIPTNASDLSSKLEIYKNGSILNASEYTLSNLSETNIEIKFNSVLGVNNTYEIKISKDIKPIPKYAQAVSGLANDFNDSFTTPAKPFNCTFNFTGGSAKFNFTTRIDINDFKSALKVLKNGVETANYDVSYRNNEVTVTPKNAEGFAIISTTQGANLNSYNFVISADFTDLLGQTLTDREFEYIPDAEYVSALADTLIFESSTAVTKASFEKYFDISEYDTLLKQYKILNINQDYTVSVDDTGKLITVKFNEKFGYNNKFKYSFQNGFTDASGTPYSELGEINFVTETKPTQITLVEPASSTDVPGDTTVVKVKINTNTGIDLLNELISITKGGNEFTAYTITGIDGENIVTIRFNDVLGLNQVYQIILDGAEPVTLSTQVVKTSTEQYLFDDFENGLSSNWRTVGNATVAPQIVTDPDNPDNKVLKVTSNKYEDGAYSLFRDFDVIDNNSTSKQIMVSFKFRWYSSATSGNQTSAGRPSPCMVLTDTANNSSEYLQAGGHSKLRLYNTAATPGGATGTFDTAFWPLLNWTTVKYIINLNDKSITLYNPGGSTVTRYFNNLLYEDTFKSLMLNSVAADRDNGVEASYYFDDLTVMKIGTVFAPSEYTAIGKDATLENVAPSAFEFSFAGAIDASTFDASDAVTLMDSEGNALPSDKISASLKNDNKTLSVVYADASFDTVYKIKFNPEIKDEYGAYIDDGVFKFKTSGEVTFNFVSSAPVNGATGISPSDNTITFTFNSPVNQSEFKNYFTLKMGDEFVNQNQYTVEYSLDGLTATVKLNKPFGASKTYSYRLMEGLTDKFYNMSSNKDIHRLNADMIGSFETLPVAFSGTRTEPIKDANVAINSDEIIYEFTTPVDETSLRAALEIEKDGVKVKNNNYTVTITPNGEGSVVVIKLSERFGPGKTITVKSVNLKDIYGQAIENEIDDTFTTQMVEFKVLNVLPADGVAFNTYDKSFKITFTTRVTKNNLKDNFVFKKGNYEAEVDSVSVSEDGLTATIHTKNELGFGTTYNFDFKDGFKDEYNQSLVRTSEPAFTFTSATPEAGIAKLVSPSTVTDVAIYDGMIEVRLKTPVSYDEFSKNVVIKRNGVTLKLVGLNPDNIYEGDYSIKESEDNVTYSIYLENDKVPGENDGILGSGNTYSISLEHGMKDMYGNEYNGNDEVSFKSKAVPLTFTLSNSNITGGTKQLVFRVSTFVQLKDFKDNFKIYKNGRELICYDENGSGSFDYKVTSTFSRDNGYQSFFVTFETELGFNNEIKYQILDSITDLYGLAMTKGYDEEKTVSTSKSTGKLVDITELITFDDMDELNNWKTTSNPTVPAKIVIDPLDEDGENKVLCLTGEQYQKPDGTLGTTIIYTRELNDTPVKGTKIYITFDYLWGLSQSDSIETGSSNPFLSPRDSSSETYYKWWIAGNSELRLQYTAKDKDSLKNMDGENSRVNNVSSAKYDTKWTTVKTIIDPSEGTMQYCIGSGNNYTTRYIKTNLTDTLKDLYVELATSTNGANGTNKALPYYIDNLKVTRVPVFALTNHIDSLGNEFSLDNVDPTSTMLPIDFTLPVKGATKNFDITKMITIKKNGVAIPSSDYSVVLDESSKQYNSDNKLIGYKTMNLIFNSSILEYNTSYTVEIAQGVQFEEYAATEGIVETTFKTSKSAGFNIDSLSTKVWNSAGNALTVTFEPNNAQGAANNVFVMLAAYDANDKFLGSGIKLWDGSDRELTVTGVNKNDVSYIKVFSFKRDLSPLQLPLVVSE